MKARPTCSVQLYLPSIEVQYRIRAGWTRIDPDLVRASWVMRPDIPKKLDWLYEQHPQSTAIDRDKLLQELAPETPVPAAAPDASMGVYLNPKRIERLQLSNGVHERESWEVDGEAWRHQHLVP
jgi:pyridoxine/pyridoxamine 5'-phosphate oxidase